MLANVLNTRISLFRKDSSINELGEEVSAYNEVRKIWAQILPQNGREINSTFNASYGLVTHKIITRESALKDIKKSDYFVCRTQVFDIIYYNPNYKFKDRIEVFCKVREEV